MKPTFAVLALWLVALLAVLYVTRGTEAFTFLGPVFAICAIGSVVAMRPFGTRPTRSD